MGFDTIEINLVIGVFWPKVCWSPQRLSMNDMVIVTLRMGGRVRGQRQE